MDPLWLFLVFLRASVFSVGGQTALPLIREDLTQAGAVSDAQIIEALTIGRLSSGPGGLYFVALGYLAGGWIGAGVALVAMAVPPLVVLPASRWLRPRLRRRRVNGLMRGLALTAAGLVVATSAHLLLPSGGGVGYLSWWQLVLVVIGLGIGLEGKRHPALVIGFGALIGLLLS